MKTYYAVLNKNGEIHESSNRLYDTKAAAAAVRDKIRATEDTPGKESSKPEVYKATFQKVD